MSRSFKHTPICKSAPTSRYDGVRKAKRIANKRVRHRHTINGSYYKRIYNPWEIHDCIDFWSWPMQVEHFYQSRNQWYLHRYEKPNFLRWAKSFLRK